MSVIDEFKNEFRFLSNFFDLTDYGSIVFEGIKYPTLEHAYQAAKTTSLRERESLIRYASTPGQAKRFGKSIKLRDDWEEVKDKVMMRLLLIKFYPGGSMADALELTENDMLIEGNTWGDTYWGFDFKLDAGKNMLGKMLMAIRKRNREIYYANRS